MNIKFSLNLSGLFLMFFGPLMLIPLTCNLFYKEEGSFAFLISALFTFLIGFFLRFFTRSKNPIDEIKRKDAFLLATLFYVFAGIFGSIPYLIYGVFSNPVDAIFESFSGFTTTGASVLYPIEGLPHNILLWRSMSQWLGGMGIVILGIAILPRLAVGGMQLMGLEAPGPTTEKITPRIAETAKKLWGVYLLLTLILIGLLYVAGMPFFDSILHSFTTIAIGGFSPKNISIEAYNNIYIEVIIMLFMFLAGINFVLHYKALTGNFQKIWKSTELKFYILVNIIFISLVTLHLQINIYTNFYEALRYASFQVISISTTTGFHSTNFNAWPEFAKFVLLSLMFFGACAGSTSGSIKSIRILVLLRKGYSELRKLVYPNIVAPVRIDRKVVKDDIISDIVSFFLIYIFISVLSTMIILALENVSIVTAISAAAATLGNVGPGLEQIGPEGNYALFSDPTKIFLSFLMVMGRLELYAILVLLTPAFWRK